MRQTGGGDTVYLAGGTYHANTPLNLTAADSGSSFLAMSGEKVTISGGTPVAGWTKGADGIWSAHVSDADVLQLTVNGVKQVESRFPNVDPNDPIKGGWLWGQDLPAGRDPGNSLAFNPSDFPPGHEPKVGQTVTVFAENGYANDKLTIASVSGNVMTFSSEANYDLGPASRFFVSEPVPDGVGEWSFDSATQTVRYKAPDGFTGEGAVTSGDHSLFVVDGAKDVTFKGLTFTDTAASTGDPETAAIEAHDATGMVLEGNHFLNVGVGVALHGGSSGNLLSGNSFDHIWSSAIAMTAGTSGNHVTNNVIDHSGEVFVQFGAIDMQESARNQIDHNTITNVPRFGIGEINYDPGNPSGGNIIEYNDIRHSGQQTPDVGAIYLFSGDDSGAAGDTIRYNHIVDAGGLNTQDGGFAENWSSGIYLDNMASNAQIYGNFIQGTTFAGVYIHGGSGNQIHDNTILDNGKYGVSMVVADDFNITGNQVYENFIQVSADGSNTIDTDQSDPRLIHGNVYYNPNGGELTVADLSLAAFQQRGGDAGSVVTTVGGFTDPLTGNYGFLSGSVAAAHGIESLPFGSVGSTLTGVSPVVPDPVAPPIARPPTEGVDPVPGSDPVTPPVTLPPTEVVDPVAPPIARPPTEGVDPVPGSDPVTPPVALPPTEVVDPVTPPIALPPTPDVILVPEVDPVPVLPQPDVPQNPGHWSGWGGQHGWGGQGGGRDWFQQILAHRNDDDGGGRNWLRDSQARLDDNDDHQAHQLSHWHW